MVWQKKAVINDTDLLFGTDLNESNWIIGWN
jgi:hypothetical protein